MLGVADITEELTEEEHTKEHIIMLKNSIQRLDKLIGEILEYSRNARNDVRHERIDFEKLLADVTKDILAKFNLQRKVDINISISGNGVLFSDHHRISVVLNNLISNAINYRKLNEQHPFVKINITIDNDKSIIAVEDNGIGIAEEQHDKIFEMFYRGSNASVGSGLGLYVVKETIEKLHGEICVESAPGVGTKFRLHLPNLLYQ
jgi:signal transduction histidine kinase